MTGWLIRWLPIPAMALKKITASCQKNSMEAYGKYNYFHMKQRPRSKPDPFKTENFYYNEEYDYCICPMGQRMQRIVTRHLKTASGYVSENARYRAVRCEGCPLR